MKLLLVMACTYTIFVLHTALARDFAIAGFAPHLMLAGLIVMTARIAKVQGVLLAAVWGLLADCLTEGRLGPSVVSYALVSVLLHRAANKWKGNVPSKLAIVSIFLIWCALVGSQLWRGVADGRTIDFVALAINAAGSAVYTALIVASAAYAIRLIVPGATERSTPASPSVSNKWRMLTE